MREVNNNNIEVGKITKPEVATHSEKADEIIATEEKVVKDFSNPKAEILGRSQVNSADNLKNDVNFAIKNPEAIKDADKFFEYAYAKLLKDDVPNAYEKAAAMSTLFAREKV